MKNMSSTLNVKNNSEGNVNYQMCILSAIGIIFVMIGHLNYGLTGYDTAPPGSFYNWFPYYSFHMPLFLFVTGYFFRDIKGNDIKSYGLFILKKAKNLLLPYYVINGLFLLLDTVIYQWGFTFGRTFNLIEWLTYPWTKYYTITFSLPTWYLIGLFIAEIYFILIRKIMSIIIKKEFVREITLLAFTLIVGMVIVYIKNTYGISETGTVYLRSLVMLFFIQVGVVYKKYIEKIDKLPNIIYFAALFALQLIIIVLSKNNEMSPGLFALTYFDTVGYGYFLAGLTGIALWLRISRGLSKIGSSPSKLVLFIGRNTKYIMAFHVFGYFLTNALFSVIYRSSLFRPMLQDFSLKSWHTYLYYICSSNPRLVLIYLIISMAVSLLIAKIMQLAKKYCKELVFKS